MGNFLSNSKFFINSKSVADHWGCFQVPKMLKLQKQPTSSSFMMRTQSLRMCVGAPKSFVKAFNVLYLKGGPATLKRGHDMRHH